MAENSKLILLKKKTFYINNSLQADLQNEICTKDLHILNIQTNLQK